ncbi:MAG: transcription-repair coupling factor [Sedimentisphaerales bacterium]|nr:transcription-repair coupling factor [Sedimentisphaerales bacterium]
MDLGQDKIVRQVIARLQNSADTGDIVKVEGTWGSFARCLSAYIATTISRPILYICPHIDDAEKVADDVHTFGCEQVEPLNAWEGREDIADATDEVRAQRLKLVSRISSREYNRDGNHFFVTSSIQALCQPIPEPRAIEAGSLRLHVGKQLSPEELLEWLVRNRFERVDGIDLPGQFARRGGIIDIYAPLINEKTLSGKEEQQIYQNAEAFRIEFFGDTVESIREINLDTLRSSRQIESITVVTAVCGNTTEQRDLFLNILPEETIIIFEEPNEIQEVAQVFLARSEDTAGLYKWADIFAAAKKFTQLHLCRFATSQSEDFVKVDIKSVQQYQHKATSVWAGHKAALEELVAESKRGKYIRLYCESPAEIKRVSEIIRDINKEIPSRFKLILGFIHQGFVINSLRTIVISHHELFGQYTLRQRRRPARATAPIESLGDLQQGDYVVHTSYGIGKFLGIETIREKTGTNEYLTIEYADKVKIQVSVRNIALVQKFIGTSPSRPKLSKIGSKKWLRQKEKVTRSVNDLAAELLEVQAKRQAAGGIAFSEDSSWQVEFEESFAYQETPDQTTAVEQIKADMQQPFVMDRLLCGDVGYGKTELAMRAAFKAIENGKQVAVLTPTTVLSVQHGRTFTERFADFPVWIEVLNRFKTPKETRDIIARTKAGKVDILIGTHRLFSGDVDFKDIGLLIIDEEQRFGVEHKEKLKKLRVNVDILTMTATPIPRTLHMSLLGLRDISSLGTPPLDRRSIVTKVTAYDKRLIARAIYQELNRQGQVFFLHNRVKTIEKKAWEIRKLAGDARVGIAHGQMSKSELETAMIQFVMGKIDVLVCTTIIESGLDIPNANTIFIDDADRFGLAELHQLRGRVGRYKHRAYAYMLLPMSRPITPLAAKRLKAIEEYSHLGAGFRIALRDLEIRGAGNILGPEQSGHIQTVGYQMYCELLANAVRRLKNEPVEVIPTSVVDLGFATFIPKDYIPVGKNRLDAYRKIAVAKVADDLEQIRAEFADVYGPVPDEVDMLLDLAELRIMASGHHIKSIITSGLDIIFTFEKNFTGNAAAMFSKARGEIRVPEPNVIYMRPEKNYFEPKTLISILRKILAVNHQTKCYET